MTSSKKNSRRQTDSPEKRVYRYWVWLVLVGPALFFIYYWITAGREGNAPSPQPLKPEVFLQAGQPAAIEGKTLLAAPGSGAIFSEQIALGGNRIIAEGGYTFTIIPLVIPDTMKAPSPSPSQWYLAGENSRKYDLLKVLDQNPAGDSPVYRPETGNRLIYLVFKVLNEPGDLFLVYSPGKEYAAWQIRSRKPEVGSQN